MVDVKSENSKIQVGVNTGIQTTAVNTNTVNLSNPVSATNSMAKYYSDLAQQSAQQSANSAGLAKESATTAEYWAGQAVAGQIQADCSQTDINQKDYIKNKYLSNFVNDLEFQTASQLATALTPYRTASAQDEIDDTKQEILVSGTNIKTINNNSILGAGNLDIDGLPAQTDNEGKFLTTDGENASWEEVHAGGSGFNLFDIVKKDRLLTYEESEGFALFGSYVYKNPVEGARYGYSDFYNEVLEEFHNSAPKVIYETKIYPQPVLTANGTLGGSSFAVSATNVYYQPYYPFSAAASGDGTSWVSSGNNNDYIIYFPEAVQLASMEIENRNQPSGVRAITEGTIYGSDDNVTYEEVNEFTNDVVGNMATWILNIGATKKYKYYKLNCRNNGAYVGIGKIRNIRYVSLSIQLFDGDKHTFYDIADKELIDELYEKTGTSDFYGIDEENERICLPRKASRYLVECKKATESDPNYYNLYSDGWCEQGGYQSASTTSTTVELLRQFKTSDFSVLGQVANASYNSNNTTNLQVISKTVNSITFGTVTSIQKIYWEAKGYVEIPDNLPFYEYMVVGNASIHQSATNVLDVTTSENDTLPLFYPIYYQGNPDSSCWALADTWCSGSLYSFTYNACVNALSTGSLYGLNVKEYGDLDIGDFDIVVNQSTMQFKTPKRLKETIRSIIAKGENNYNGNWVLYSDGYYEETGTLTVTATANSTITFSKEFKDENYSFSRINKSSNTSTPTNFANEGFSSKTTNSITIYTNAGNLTTDVEWKVSGYIVLEETDSKLKLYFKVGNAIKNQQVIDIAGVTNALNQKIDKSDCVRYAVEKSDPSLMPSWYVVYNDGWIEQGGDAAANTSSITLLKPFKTTTYAVFAVQGDVSFGAGRSMNAINKTTTGFDCHEGTGASSTNNCWAIQSQWFAYGY